MFFKSPNQWPQSVNIFVYYYFIYLLTHVQRYSASFSGVTQNDNDSHWSVVMQRDSNHGSWWDQHDNLQ